MNVLEHWSVDFCDFTVPPPPTDDPDILRFGDLLARAARNGARHGTPCDHLSVRSAGPSHQPVLPYGAYGGTRSKHLASVCVRADRVAGLLGCHRQFVGLRERTRRRSVQGLANHGPANDERIRPTSFDTDRVALNSFYTWASSRYGTADQNAQLKGRLAAATKALAHEQTTSAALRRIIAELDLELHQAQDSLEHAGNVTRLPAPRRSRPYR